MADTDNDIQKSLGYITEALDSLRAQNAMNSGDLGKALSGISSHLETLADDESTTKENSDLIKVFLGELKKNLEERHNFVISKFNEIDGAFKRLSKKTEASIHAGEVKEAFDVIGANISTFSAEFGVQKELVSKIGLKIDELKQDETQKQEILKNISTLKVEVEKFNNGLGSLVLNINDSFKSVVDQVSKLDLSDELKSIKKEVEDVFLSSNAILSAIKVVDHKNRELEDILGNFVTREDFILEREQVSKLIAQNIEITEYLNGLPTQNNFGQLSEKVDTAVGVINALKNVITESGKQNQKLLTAQLDNLEAKILNISTEEEFIGFRKELSEFAKEVVDSSNAMRADLADTNAELKTLLSYMSAMDIKNTFENFAGLTKVSESNLRDNISTATEAISNGLNKVRDLVKGDVEGSTLKLGEKINTVKEDLNDASRINLSTILENLQLVINNVLSVKDSMHIENLENLGTIDSKLTDVKEEILTSNSFIAQNTKVDLGDILFKVEKVVKELSGMKDVLNNNSTEQAKSVEEKFSQVSERLDVVRNEINQNSIDNFPRVFGELENIVRETGSIKAVLSQASNHQLEKAEANFESLSRKIDGIKEDLHNNSQESFSGILSIVEKFASEISDVKEKLKESSDESSQNAREFLAEVSDKLNSLQDNLIRISELGVSEVKATADEIAQTMQATKAGLEQISSAGFANIKNNIERLAQDVDLLKETFNNKSQSNLESIVSLFEALNEGFESYKELTADISRNNLEAITSSIREIPGKIEAVKGELNLSAQANISELRETISALPSIIKENQVIFEDEKRTLLQENSKSIGEVGEKIQNLVKGLVAKENPFKSEVMYEFSQLKSNLENIKNELTTSNNSLSMNLQQEVNSMLNNIEGLVASGSENYNDSLISLQSKIVEYLDNIQATTKDSDLKLNNSIKENSEIKKEIGGLLESLDILRSDNTLKTLSVEVRHKLDDVLVNINKAEEVLFSNSKENLQNILETMEEKFCSVLVDFEEYKRISSSAADTTNEFVEQLSEKIETLKVQVSLTNTDIINAVSSKVSSIVDGFAPIEAAVNQIKNIDFENLLNVKEKIDQSYYSIISVVKENQQELNEEQLQRLEESFIGLQAKLEEMSANISIERRENLEELKSSLEELYNKVERVSSSIAGANKNSILLVEKVSTIEENLLHNQNQSKEELLERLEVNKSSVKSDLQEISKNIETISEKIFEDSGEEILLEMRDLGQRINQEQNQSKNDVLDKVEDVAGAIKGNINEVSKKLDLVSEKIMEESSEELLLEMREVSQRINQEQNQVKFDILDKFDDNISLVKADLYDISKEVEVISAKLSEQNNDYLVEKISATEENMLAKQADTGAEILDKLDDTSHSINTNIQNLVGDIKDISTKLAEKNDDYLVEKVSDIEDKMLQEQLETRVDIANKFETGVSSINSELGEISGLIEVLSTRISEPNNEGLFTRVDGLEENIIHGQNENRISLLDKIDDNTSIIKTELSEIVELIEKTQEDLASRQTEISDVLNSKDEDIKAQIGEMEEVLVGEISSKLEDFKANVLITHQEIEDKLYRSEENYKLATQSLFSEIKTSFSERVEDGLDDLKSFLEVLSNRNDYTLSIDNLKSDIFDRFSELTDSVEETVALTIVKEDLDNISKEISTSVDDSLQNLYEKVLASLEDSKLSIDIYEKSDEISRRVEDLKRVISEDVSEKFDNFELKIDTQSKDFSNLIEEVKVSIAELKDDYVNLSLNSNMEISNLLMTIEGKIDGAVEKIDNFNLDSAFDALKTELKDEIASVKENVSNIDLESMKIQLVEEISSVKDSFSTSDLDEKIAQSFVEINQKLDVLALDNSAEMEEDVKEIKNVVLSQAKLLGGLKALEHLEKLPGEISEVNKNLQDLEKLSELEAIASAQNSIKEIVEGFETKLDVLSLQEVKEDTVGDELKNELKSLKEEVIENTLTVFDQISFVVEAEEIKDFVDEKIEEAKDEIISRIDEMGSFEATFVDGATSENSSLKESLADIVTEIQDVKAQLEAAKLGGDAETEYTYSLQDIESDIAKVRLILKDIAESKNDDAMEKLSCLDRLDELEKLDKLNQDIVSLSTRTNKILLNSDESYNALKTNLEDFRETVSKLEEKVKYMDTSDFTRRTEKKLEDVRSLALSSVQSNKVFNQAFTYLAEWVDNTSENIGAISERVQKVSEIESIKNSVSEIKRSLFKKSEMEEFLDRITEKFEAQQEKIESLENKISQMSKKAVKGDVDIDAIVKSAVEAVVEQMGAHEVKPDAKLAKKVDNIDKQLAKLSKGIEKITSYVEED